MKNIRKILHGGEKLEV